MSGRKKIVMTKAVRERLQKDIAYGNDMQAYWNRYRRDFLILLAVLLLIMLAVPRQSAAPCRARYRTHGEIRQPVV